MTTTESAALEAMLSHHAALADGVTRRVEALRSAVREGGDHEAARAGLLAYAAGEVLPHAEVTRSTASTGRPLPGRGRPR